MTGQSSRESYRSQFSFFLKARWLQWLPFIIWIIFLSLFLFSLTLPSSTEIKALTIFFSTAIVYMMYRTWVFLWFLRRLALLVTLTNQGLQIDTLRGNYFILHEDLSSAVVESDLPKKDSIKGLFYRGVQVITLRVKDQEIYISSHMDSFAEIKSYINSQ